MNEDNGIIINSFIVKNEKQSINLKKVLDIEYHSDQHKGACEFNLLNRIVRIHMSLSEFKEIQEEFDRINE